jgi:hypothetical protein
MASLLLSLILATPNSTEARLLSTWRAICWIESRGDPHTKPGDGGRAVGIAQIHPQMVADCNRIAGSIRWWPEDRSDPVKSFEMFHCYCLHYWPQGSPEQWARGWNGGPKGPRRAGTLGYWRNVQRAISAFP